MPDITVSYEGNTIATMSASGTKTFYTAGKYCDDDITLTYVQPGGGGGLTYENGTITPVSSTQFLSVTGLGGTPKFLRFIIEDFESTSTGGGYDGVLKALRGMYNLGASMVQQTNNGGTNAGTAYVNSPSYWESITPTIYADDTHPSSTGEIYATTTGFCARAYNTSYSFKAGYTYNWGVWY